MVCTHFLSAFDLIDVFKKSLSWSIRGCGVVVGVVVWCCYGVVVLWCVVLLLCANVVVVLWCVVLLLCANVVVVL